MRLNTSCSKYSCHLLYIRAQHSHSGYRWHGTVLAKLALVPQRILNSYMKPEYGSAEDGVYKDGDFIANYAGCDAKDRSCETEMAALLLRLKELNQS